MNTIILETTVTDHYPTLVCFPLCQQGYRASSLREKLDVEAFEKDLVSIDGTSILESTDANHATDLLLAKISSLMLKHTKYIKIPKKERIIKPWITKGLLRCIRNRDRLHSRLKKNQDNIVLKVTYTRYRNFCNRILRSLKRSYERSELEKAKGNPKALWEVIKNIACLHTNRSKNNELLGIESSPAASLNAINKYFANIGKDLANKIMTASETTRNACTRKVTSGSLLSMGLIPVHNAEIEAVILSLKTNCALGWDKIPANSLIRLRKTLSPLITHICNLATSSGTFPSAFKKAIVHPIFKGGCRLEIGNYRPISVLSTGSKVLEKVLNKALVKYLNTNNVIAPNQFGFRIGKGTEDAILSITESIVEYLDNKKKCLGIFLDFSKAFDTVSIPLLLNKLEAIGIRGIVHDILKDYLSNRTQIVSLDGHISNEEILNYGVPQGSILGPTLFQVYVNDLCCLDLPNCKIFAYADDTAVLINGDDWDECKRYAEGAMRRIMQWLQTNLLTLNINKSNYVTYSMRQSSRPSFGEFNIKAHTCNEGSKACSCPNLTRSNAVKYLGVYVDESLNWHKQLETLAARIRKLIFIFKKLRYSADMQTLKLVYTSLCQSVLSYCIPVWGGADKTSMILLERAQRAIIKVLGFKSFRYPTSTLYTEMQLLTVRQIYVVNTILRRHTTVKPPNSSTNTHRRKPKPCIYVPSRTVFARNQYSSRSQYLYNKLNSYLHIQGQSRFQCKRKVTAHMLTLTYDDTEAILKSNW